MTTASSKSPDRHKGRLIGAYVPDALVEAIAKWIAGHPERNQSVFIREAIREKLSQDGIRFHK
jgi:hypothetical protein